MDKITFRANPKSQINKVDDSFLPPSRSCGSYQGKNNFKIYMNIYKTKPSCKAQWKGEEDKADKGRGGKTTSGTDRPGVRQVPEGSGEQGKMEKTGCKIICGAPTTLAVKGLMMMMMMMIIGHSTNRNPIGFKIVLVQTGILIYTRINWNSIF